MPSTTLRQSPEYLAEIKAALAAQGESPERAKQLAQHFFPDPKVLPLEQVRYYLATQRQIQARNDANNFFVMNFLVLGGG